MISRKKFTVLATSSLFFFSLCSSSLATNKITTLPNIHEIKNAKLALLPLNIDTYSHVTEEDVLKWGCVFVTDTDSDKNSELLQILKSDVELSEQGERAFRLRTVIYLYLNDGSEFKLSISDAHNIKPGVFGIIINKQRQSETFFTSNESMLRMLRSWAKGNLRIQNPDSLC